MNTIKFFKSPFVAFVACFIFVLGCKEQQDKRFTETMKIEINNPTDIPFMELVCEIDTIRLEVTDESIMDNITQMHIMDDKFYILTNKRSSIHIFDITGKFISKIENRGNGPNEYISIFSFKIDKVNKRIILADVFSKKILIYDEYGNQMEVIKLDFTPSSIVTHNNGFININSGPKNSYSDEKMNDYYLHFLDNKGKYISSAIKCETKKSIEVTSSFNVDCQENGDILFHPILSNIIYKIDKDSVYARYEFLNSSNYRFLSQEEKHDFELIYGERNDMQEKEKERYLLSWGGVIDMDDYIFFSFSGWEKPHYLYYFKDEKKSLLVDAVNAKGDKVLNEIFLSSPKATYGNKFFISPNLLIVEKNKGTISNEIINTFFKNTDLESNPILISFSLKSP